MNLSIEEKIRLEEEEYWLRRSAKQRKNLVALIRLASLERFLLDRQREIARRERRTIPPWLRPKPKQNLSTKVDIPRTGSLVRELGLADKVLYRPLNLTRSAEGDRVIALTASSDEPYQRRWGIEILDHSPKSIKLERLERGAMPLLYNHNQDNHLGRVMSARTDGRKLHVQARFGRGPLASEKFQDVEEGILREASIGYVIDEMVEEQKGTFRATKWTPHEVSLVTVPADTTVGIGRA